MTLPELLSELEKRCVKLSVNDGKLNFSAPKNAVDPELRSALKYHKSELLELFASEKDEPIAVDSGDAEPAVVASLAQQRMWFLTQLETPAELYAVHLSWHCHGQLHIGLVEQTLDALVKRHRVLRTRIVDIDNEVLQIVDEHKPFGLEVIDTQLLAIDWRIDAEQYFGKPFDLSADLMLRARLYVLGEDHYVLCLVTHHVAIDGWSASILKQEFGTIYRALLNTKTPQLQPLSCHYSDYAREQHAISERAGYAENLDRWMTRLSGELPNLKLPFDRPRPKSPTYTGNSLVRKLPDTVVESFNVLASQHGVTLFVVMLAAFQAFLYRYTGERDVLVGTPVANRSQANWQSLVGFFVNNLVMRVNVEPQASFVELLKTVNSVRQATMDAESVPFELLVQTLQPDRHLSMNPLFQVMFLMQNASGDPLQLPGVTLNPIEHLGRQTAKFDLALEIRPLDSGTAAYEYNLNYSTELFNSDSMNRMADCFDTFVVAISVDPDQPIAKALLLPSLERSRVLNGFNKTAVPLPKEQTINALFQRQLEASPDAIALIEVADQGRDNGVSPQTMTYRALAARAVDIQFALHAAGCSAGDIVCIAIERSTDFVAAMLGVLQAGAVWCPLDPSYPTERLAYLFADSGASLLLQRGSTSLVGDIGDAHLIALDDRESIYSLNTEMASATLPMSCPLPVLPPMGEIERQRYQGGAAYLIYTSGSSGLPKGVIGTHRGAINRFSWMWNAYPFSEDDVACIKTAVSFVDSIWECFGALLQGIPSVLVGKDAQNPIALIDHLNAHKVTRFVGVPSLLAAMLEHISSNNLALPNLNHCISSGEALPMSLARRLLSINPDLTLLNLYGSSEVAADVTCYEVSHSANSIQLPIGRPIDNTHIYILDEHQNIVPPGVLGELHVSGCGVAMGYHAAEPELNAKFMVNPFSELPEHDTMFRTGDRGYWTSDGKIVCVGRMDRQVKVRGVRVDCGEVEALLQTDSRVFACYVYVHTHADGDSLSAAIVPALGANLTFDDVSRFVRDKAPAWMMPTNIILVDRNSSARITCRTSVVNRMAAGSGAR